MVEVPGVLMASLAGPVGAAIPVVRERVPAPPAVELGRMGAPPGMDGMIGHPTAAMVRPGLMVAGPAGISRAGTDSPLLAALRSVGQLVVERLLGALELTVPTLEFAGVPDLSRYLGPGPAGRFGFAQSARESEAVKAARMLAQLRPDAVELIEVVSKGLASLPEILALLAPSATATDEVSISAAHGAAYLALGVATASAVLTGHVPGAVDGTAATIGLGIGAAVLLLEKAPMPAAYADALLAKVRKEYLLPRRSAGSVTVSDNRFGLTEGEVPSDVEFSGNGLVTVVDGGVVVRTGAATGSVHIWLNVSAEAPPSVETNGWDEVVEVSWRATEGRASVIGPDGSGEQQLRWATPPWPGDYRLRVHARGRDEQDDEETYELVVWQAPAAPEIVHLRTDVLGHRLRGEPEPVRAPRPEKAYTWLRHTGLSEAATVTVVTGTSVEEVLRAFGADPAQLQSLQEISMRSMFTDPWVAVLATDDAVIAVEYNGYQGSHGSVLRRASASGRAASMFWNVNALTQLSFAENGEVLAGFEPPGVPDDADPSVLDALADLDFDDYRDTEGKGLVAVQRFTGRGFTEEDLALIETADIAFLIVPDLPDLHPYYENPTTPDALLGLSEERLRDFAWWCARQAAHYAGLADDPDISASIEERALTPEAHARARQSQLLGGEHRWMWMALHRATNPDPLAAATQSLEAARYSAGPHATDLVDNAFNQLK